VAILNLACADEADRMRSKAIVSTLGALIAFVLEMLMASRGLRAEVAQRRRSAEEDSSDIPATDEVSTQADHVTIPSP